MNESQLAWLKARVPEIQPVPQSVHRPLWSVVIPVHNRLQFLHEAIRSVLAQDPGPERMQIEVIDDGSARGEAEELVRSLGGGRVTYFRQSANVGQCRNVNEGICRARGRWIHVLHDDDWVQQGFYASIESSLPDDTNIGAVLTRVTTYERADRPRREFPLERSQPGILEDWLWKLVTNFRVQPPAAVVLRTAYETLGGYNPDFPLPADWEMWQRIASHFTWWYEPGARACYRTHANAMTLGAKRSGLNIVESRAVIAFAQNYFPPEQSAKLRAQSTRLVASFAYRAARRLVAEGDFEGAAAQIIECLRTDSSRDIVRAITSISQSLTDTVPVR